MAGAHKSKSLNEAALDDGLDTVNRNHEAFLTGHGRCCGSFDGVVEFPTSNPFAPRIQLGKLSVQVVPSNRTLVLKGGQS